MLLYFQVKDTPTFWNWAKTELIPGLYNTHWYNGQKFEYEEGFVSSREAFMVGMPRLRQLRIKPGMRAMGMVYQTKNKVRYEGEDGWGREKGRSRAILGKYEFKERGLSDPDLSDETQLKVRPLK